MNSPNIQELAERRLDIETQLKEARADLSKAEIATGAAQAAMHEAMNARDGYGRLYSRSKESADSMTRKRYETAVRDFESKERAFQQAREIRDGLKRRVSELEGQIAGDGWGVRMRAALTAYQAAQAEKAERQPELERLRAEIGELGRDIRRIQTETQAQEGIFSKAMNRADLAAARGALEKLQGELKDLEQLKKNQEQRLPLLEKVLADIETRMKRAEGGVWRAKLDGLREEFWTQNRELVENIVAVTGKASYAFSSPAQTLNTALGGFKIPKPDELEARQKVLAAIIGLE